MLSSKISTNSIWLKTHTLFKKNQKSLRAIINIRWSFVPTCEKDQRFLCLVGRVRAADVLRGRAKRGPGETGGGSAIKAERTTPTFQSERSRWTASRCRPPRSHCSVGKPCSIVTFIMNTPCLSATPGPAIARTTS